MQIHAFRRNYPSKRHSSRPIDKHGRWHVEDPPKIVDVFLTKLPGTINNRIANVYCLLISDIKHCSLIISLSCTSFMWHYAARQFVENHPGKTTRIRFRITLGKLYVWDLETLCLMVSEWSLSKDFMEFTPWMRCVSKRNLGFSREGPKRENKKKKYM